MEEDRQSDPRKAPRTEVSDQAASGSGFIWEDAGHHPGILGLFKAV